MQMNFDSLYIKYGLKYFYLLQAVEHYKISDDDDVKDLDKSLRMQKQKLIMEL